MARSKRPATQTPGALTATSNRGDVMTWLREFIPGEILGKLNKLWDERGELVDGDTILQADRGLLMALGVSVSVADKIVRKVQEGRGATQELAPATQQLQQGAPADVAPAGQQQRSAGRREPPRRMPAATQPTQVQQTQATQAAQVKPDPEQLEAEAAAWQQQVQQQPTRRSRRQQQQQQQQAAKEEQQDEAEADAEAEQQDQQQQDQQQAMDADGGEEQQQQQQEGEEEDVAEEEEDTVALAPPRVKQEQQQQLGAGASGSGGGGAAALDEHSMPLSGGPTTRRTSHQQQQQAQAVAPQQQQQQQLEQGGPSEPRRILTRRQQRQQVEQQALRETRRNMRLSTMHERQRRQEEEEQSNDDEEDEDEEPAAVVQAQAQAGEGGEQEEVDTEDDEEEGPVVVEDLGPEADSGMFEKDWKRRCLWGLAEIFSSMSVDQLRELVEEQQEWPELAKNCLRVRKKVDGVGMWVDLDKPRAIAARLINFIVTGSPDGKPTEAGGINKAGIKELLRDYCDEAVREYVKHKLTLRYQNVPRFNNAHKLMWHLWHYPNGPANDVLEVLLGRKTLEYETITGGNLEPPAAIAPYTLWPRVWEALERNQLHLKDQDDHMLWLTHMNDLSGHPRAKVIARLDRQPGNRRLHIYLYQLIHKDTLSSSLISGTWRREAAGGGGEGGGEEELVAVDLYFVLSNLEGFDGSPFMEQMDRLTDAYNQSHREIEAMGVPTELDVDSPLNFKQFDKVMACVEDIDRGEPAGFKQQCDDDFLLTLRPYQRRALSHMLSEERAAGGAARHLWVKLNLPEQPDIQCYVSPILHQIRLSTSRIEAEHWVHANGGAGWISLQMGMGKTACAVGAMQLNPVPQGWRKNRSYQKLRAGDHLASIVNNMPHGGTLIVMPPTLIDQWEDEIRKTTSAELSILKWTETSKRRPRTEDCKEIARYDIVMTTFQLASTLHTLSHIRWWRMIVDEPQLGAGGFLADKDHTWFANHRWLLTGTPINATVETMTPSMEFLKLGSFDALYRHFPPVITHVLKHFMVRYTKKGKLDGETNLELPPIVSNDVKWELNDEDQTWYHQLTTEQRTKFRAQLLKAHIEADSSPLGDGDDEYESKKPRLSMMKIRGMLHALRQAASSALLQLTGAEHYDNAKGMYIKERHWYQSKAEAVIDVLSGKDPEEKVLIFSEYPNTLRAIKALLPDIGLQSRNLIGSTTSAGRGKAIRDFQTDPPTKVFLLTYRAGGAGITLTAGTHIILCEPTLNPSFGRQAIGRSHRMGQDKQLTVTRILMKGTIEEKIAEFVKRQQHEEEEEDPDDLPASTAMEANPASNDETNKLTLEDLNDMINRI